MTETERKKKERNEYSLTILKKNEQTTKCQYHELYTSYHKYKIQITSTTSTISTTYTGGEKGSWKGKER